MVFDFLVNVNVDENLFRAEKENEMFRIEKHFSQNNELDERVSTEENFERQNVFQLPKRHLRSYRRELSLKEKEKRSIEEKNNVFCRTNQR